MTESHASATIQRPQSGALTRQDGQNTRSINVGQTERWLSAIGGGALVVYGLSQRSLVGFGLALLGGGLAYRGASGHCSVYQALGMSTADAKDQEASNLHVEKTVTVSKSPEEVYRFWRNFENLPQFMKHLESVTTSDDKHSHWVAKAPAGTTVAWDAEVILDRPNELIAWRSLPGADVDNGGSVRFLRAPDGRGTEVKVTLEYHPPAGVLGAAVAKLFGEEPSQQIEGDLRRLKNVLEAGEVPTTEGQASGRAESSASDKQSVPAVQQDPLPATVPSSDSDHQQAEMTEPDDVVQEASEESMEGSDPPAWTDRRLGQANKEVGA